MTNKQRNLIIDWLVNHPDCWVTINIAGKGGRETLFKILQVAGLYSYKTNWFDVNLKPLIEMARKRLETQPMKGQL